MEADEGSNGLLIHSLVTVGEVGGVGVVPAHRDIALNRRVTGKSLQSPGRRKRHPILTQVFVTMASQGTSSLSWTDEQLHAAADAAGIALWSWNIDTDEISLDERAYRLWGIQQGYLVTFRKLSERIHPVDVERVGRAFEAVRHQTGSYEIDFCILDNDQRRWISARGQGGGAGMVERVMFGIFTDITTRKEAEDAREMLAGEMSHRVKNLFAIASALTGIAARSTTTKEEMADDLTLRLNALGQAHGLVLPMPTEAARKGAKLDEVLAALLSPYDDRNSSSDIRVHLAVPELQVGATAVTTLALVVHELATNSLKYGALGAATGKLNVTCTDRDKQSSSSGRNEAGHGAKLLAGTGSAACWSQEACRASSAARSPMTGPSRA